MIRKFAALIEIPNSIWKTFPASRSFLDLTNDLEGAARRVKKGVNVRLEETRYSQLCSHIESSAIELICAKRKESTDRQFANLQLKAVNMLELKYQQGSDFFSLASVAQIDSVVSPSKMMQFVVLLDITGVAIGSNTERTEHLSSTDRVRFDPTVRQFITSCVSRKSGLVITFHLGSL